MGRILIAILMLTWAKATFAHDGQLAPGSPAAKGIEIFEKRVQEYPQSAMDRVMLARLYVQAGSSTHDTTFFAKGEQSARSALQMRPDSKDAALALASALAGQHRFADAIALVEPIVKAHPEDDSAILALGDARLSFGDVSAAQQAYADVSRRVRAPAVEARLSHLAQVRGDNAGAIHHMQDAIGQLDSLGAEADETNWYCWRLADLYLHTGQPKPATDVLEVLLQRSPDYQPAIISLALSYAALGDVERAIDLMRRAVARSPDLVELATLGDLEALAGHDLQAKALYARAIRTGESDPHLARPLAMFLLDHERSPQRALELAQNDLNLRHDFYTYDLLAWAQLAKGQIEQANQSIEKALAEGTQDAQILYHAGMIALANGERALARARLELAMQINPHFSLSQLSTAVQKLADLKAEH